MKLQLGDIDWRGVGGAFITPSSTVRQLANKAAV